MLLFQKEMYLGSSTLHQIHDVDRIIVFIAFLKSLFSMLQTFSHDSFLNEILRENACQTNKIIF